MRAERSRAFRPSALRQQQLQRMDNHSSQRSALSRSATSYHKHTALVRVDERCLVGLSTPLDRRQPAARLSGAGSTWPAVRRLRSTTSWPQSPPARAKRPFRASNASSLSSRTFGTTCWKAIVLCAGQATRLSKRWLARRPPRDGNASAVRNLPPALRSASSRRLFPALCTSRRPEAPACAIMLGKRCASEMEACLTEYYRQECLRALYAKQERPRDCAWVSKDMMAKPPRRARKRVSFATVLDIIGNADASVDRRSIEVSPVSRLEIMELLAQRTFPGRACT